MLNQCYDFVFELLPEERQREVEVIATKMYSETEHNASANELPRPHINIEQDNDALISE